jgi:L-threonylcarbamoyladenylate synthase
MADMDSRIVEQADLVLDAGVLQGGVGSTVVDVSEDPPRILREGQVTAGQVMGALTGKA